MEIIKTNKGGKKLLDTINKFEYVIKRETTVYTMWRCAKFSAPTKCRATLRTDGIQPIDEGVPNHNHVRDSPGIKVMKCYAEMKKRAKQSEAKPAQIYVQGVVNLSPGTRARMPTEDSAKRTFRNYQRSHMPVAPLRLEDVCIEGDWAETGGQNKERFLLHDNGPDADSRMMVFATDRMLSLLADAVDWYMDGNFQLAPNLFKQLYVIRVVHESVQVTVAYIWLQNKSRAIYEELFSILVQKCRDRRIFLDPHNFYVDFEIAVFKAVQEIFGMEVTIQGCFYHLCQSTYRKIQDLGLVGTYKHNSDFNKFCGMMDGLAFLPLEDVVNGMKELREVALPDAKELCRYFDETYVTGTLRTVGNGKRLNVKIRRKPALFPPKTWNVHDRTLEGASRTNNSTEGWNNRFKYIVNMTHPSVYNLITKMREELASDYTKLDQQDLGRIARKKKRTQAEMKEQQLFNLCGQYLRQKQDMKKFLTSISEIIRFRSLY